MKHKRPQLAIVVRLAAFVIAAAGAVTILTALVATTAGRLPHQPALVTVAIASILILVASFVVRPFDPLRH